MIDAFRAVPSNPPIRICKPVPAFSVNFSIRPKVIRDEILPLVERIGKEKDAPIVDLYTALSDAGHLASSTGIISTRRTTRSRVRISPG